MRTIQFLGGKLVGYAVRTIQILGGKLVGYAVRTIQFLGGKRSILVRTAYPTWNRTFMATRPVSTIGKHQLLISNCANHCPVSLGELGS